MRCAGGGGLGEGGKVIRQINGVKVNMDMTRVGMGLTGWALALGAAAEPSRPASTEPLAAGSLLQVVLGLILVLLVIGGLAILSRRVLHYGGDDNGQLSILAGLSMGPRERIVLLRAGRTQLVVAVCPGRIQTLHVLDEPAPEVTRRDNIDGQKGFQAQLTRLLGRRGPGDNHG